jgi:hypothetical protein
MLTEGQAGTTQQGYGNGATLASSFTVGLGSLKVAQAEGECDEASRGGIRYQLQSSGATGIAPVQALPTTAAQWLLYMPLAAKTTAFIDELGEWLVSGTAGAGGTVLYAVCGPTHIPTAAPNAMAAGIVLANANPVGQRASKLIVVSGATLAANPGWAPLAWMNPAGTVLGQTQMVKEKINGALMIPPGCAIALAVISPTGTTPLFAPYGRLREYMTSPE